MEKTVKYFFLTAFSPTCQCYLQVLHNFDKYQPVRLSSKLFARVSLFIWVLVLKSAPDLHV